MTAVPLLGMISPYLCCAFVSANCMMSLAEMAKFYCQLASHMANFHKNQTLNLPMNGIYR